MPLTVTCQQCRQGFAVAPFLYGQRVNCPKCQAILNIPKPLYQSAEEQLEDVSELNTAAVRPAVRHHQIAGVIILCSIIGGATLVLLLAAILVPRFFAAGSQEPERTISLPEARSGFQTRLIRQQAIGEAAVEPPPQLFRRVRYDSPVGELTAYLSQPPQDGKKHPAIIWIFGGFSNSIGDTAWEPADPANDQSASAFRQAGIIMMYPSLRGGNDNPGFIEGFFGEVDDVLAAADYLAEQEYVDPKRIYLGGHSTGGTLVLLAAASTDRFRAVFSFGPVEDVGGYGAEVLPFSISDARELQLRAPERWMHSIQSPVFVFEGTGQPSNIDSLLALAHASDNPLVRVFPVRGADHFSILAPVTRLIAHRILDDHGATTRMEFTEAELGNLFAR